MNGDLRRIRPLLSISAIRSNFQYDIVSILFFLVKTFLELKSF